MTSSQGIQTTSITVHEEGKTDRGALKVVSREKLDDGRFRIIYRGDFRDDCFAHVVADWLKRHGERSNAGAQRRWTGRDGSVHFEIQKQGCGKRTGLNCRNGLLFVLSPEQNNSTPQ